MKTFQNMSKEEIEVYLENFAVEINKRSNSNIDAILLYNMAIYEVLISLLAMFGGAVEFKNIEGDK